MASEKWKEVEGGKKKIENLIFLSNIMIDYYFALHFQFPACQKTSWLHNLLLCSCWKNGWVFEKTKSQITDKQPWHGKQKTILVSIGITRQERFVNKIKKTHYKSWIFNIFWSIVWVLWVHMCVLWPEAKIWGSLGMEKSSNMFYYLVVIYTTVITHNLWFPLCRVLFFDTV